MVTELCQIQQISSLWFHENTAPLRKLAQGRLLDDSYKLTMNVEANNMATG